MTTFLSQLRRILSKNYLHNKKGIFEWPYSKHTTNICMRARWWEYNTSSPGGNFQNRDWRCTIFVRFVCPCKYVG